ncbi:hypothetical protein [Absidia glauca]|uniref:Peptidase C14 caspase domain-containing protein n=1 Tax=Absidia glauca TaxID=4829 RepID=A0A168RP66_ABSGL|nr:hypothetical protein [Absidia glauca]
MAYPGNYNSSGGRGRGYPPPPSQGYPPPPHPPPSQQQHGYPPPPHQQYGYNSHATQQHYQGYPSGANQYPSSNQQQGYSNHNYAPPPPQTGPNYRPYPANQHIRPPVDSVPDPTFRPTDPSLMQAHYPQPANSTHQPAHPVPHAPSPSQQGSSQFVMHVNPAMQNVPPPNFQLSNCQGRKRALLVGINYFKSRNELRGCINDVQNVKTFLISLYNFRPEDMVVLTDDQSDPRFIPTKQNIISGMKWLVANAQPNDSGHGGSVKDQDGDEDDGYDETIYPVDHDRYPGQTGQIIDDEMNAIMVRPLPRGCRLTAIFDSCHSGTALDLPYVYSTQGAVKEQNMFKDAGSGLVKAGMAYATGNVGGALSSLMSMGNKVITGKKVNDRVKQFKGSEADVITFSGCKDDQTSADAVINAKATGAMSYSITSKYSTRYGLDMDFVDDNHLNLLCYVAALRANKNQSYLQLLNSIRAILREKYSQRPQFSSSHPIGGLIVQGNDMRTDLLTTLRSM